MLYNPTQGDAKPLSWLLWMSVQNKGVSGADRISDPHSGHAAVTAMINTKNITQIKYNRPVCV